jgi:uncharacterized Zn finger protein (UPF0148 family)
LADLPLEEKSRRISEALKRGWKMLSEVCPGCGAPLFQTNDETICPVCNARYILVKSDEEAAEQLLRLKLIELKDMLSSKAEEITRGITETENYQELTILVNLLNGILDAIHKIKKITEKEGND